jgi:3-oxoacyl-[acyl-carrier-protein] synthase II
MGAVTPLGNNLTDTWSNILSGKSGAGAITHYDSSEHKIQIAAEVKGFDGAEIFGNRNARKMDRFTQFALAAAQEALDEADLSITDENRDKIGIVIGTGIGGIGTVYQQFGVLKDKGPMRVSPFLVPMMLPDSAAGTVAIELGARGPNMSVVTACASGTNAVGEAAAVISRGDADVIIAGGAEAAIVPISMAGLGIMKAMSTRHDSPEQASRPFDKNRDGFLMGEGSGILILESYEHAIARGANILAEVSGYGITNDAFHMTHPAENGAGAALCMEMALDRAGLTINDIGYINAHGTSTPLNDKSETAAIKTVFGEQAYNVPISSTKSMTGHLLGGSGAIEAIFCTRALVDQILPPTINYETPDPECDLDYVPNTARKANIQHVMSNSFGFGGHNGTIILSSSQE